MACSSTLAPCADSSLADLIYWPNLPSWTDSQATEAFNSCIVSFKPTTDPKPPNSSFTVPNFQTDGGGMEDGPDQDPMVLSSRAIMIPGFDAIGEHTGVGHNHNIVMPFGGELPCSEGPEL
ncbi:hypothetical protein M5K25_027682 [Dendrobium thyrsiflorum]|uniref:Uncharacterized protein n=1 Tax=Dendrobium thyrsiflorum TaxID=117978 RepID=A0ABD0TUM1_DENTH